MKLNALQAELTKIERRRSQLQDQINKQAKTLYVSLPAKVGLRSIDALINALIPYASPFLRGRLNRQGGAPAAKAKAPAAKVAKTAKAPKPAAQKAPAGKRQRPRAHASEKKGAVREAFKAGSMTTRAISNKFGVPYNTLKKWKKQWGLTTAQGKGKAKK